ncbi:MAG: cobaltochelatase subunit CobN [SAR202 cluster bacterium Io17-Chloro-G9]|nr:MAG: cobaltochelatase subunit CobN [SAR202 cluster bacterium Io17-Chloro-G9]
MPAKRKNILLITTADTDILTADRALALLPKGFARLTAFNPSFADNREIPPDSQDKMVQAASRSDVVVLRLLGGKQAMPETFDPLVRVCHGRGIPVIACPGHEEWDQDLVSACTVSPAEVDTVFSYLIRGGVQNFQNLFLFLSDSYLGTEYGHEAPASLPWEGVYHPDLPHLDDGFDPGDIDGYAEKHLRAGQATVGLLFYRAHWMSGNLRPIDALIHRLEALGANVLPVFSYSLKHNPEDGGEDNLTFTKFLTDANGVPRVQCVINTMAMSMSDLTTEGPTIASPVDYLEELDVPIIQGIISTGSQEDWIESSLGLGPIDTAMSVALPEFDGRLISVPISFKEESKPSRRRGLDAQMQQYLPREDRVDLVARLAVKWANLRLKTNEEKRIAIILSNYPTKDARIGNAVGLDTPASVIRILHAMKNAGYRVKDIPESADALVHRIIERCSNDVDSLTEEQLRLAVGHVGAAEYGQRFQTFPNAVKKELQEAWGDPPGRVYRSGDSLAIAGIQLGNIFVGVQPPRGFGENPIAIYHSPDLAPTHHYLAYYHWIREIFKADAMVHVGKHGTLEWLPGKGIGLSSGCYPEVALSDLPLFYPFIINNPGEGAQAKRRAHAAIIDHLIPAMTSADSYGDIAKLEQLMDEHYQCQTLDPAKLPLLEKQIWELTKEAELNRDLGIYDQPENFGGFILEIDGYLCELKDAQIKDGLHTLGETPAGEQLIGLLSNLTRLQNSNQIPSLRGAMAQALGLDYGDLLENPGLPVNGNIPGVLAELDVETPARTQGDLLERLETLSRLSLNQLLANGFRPEEVPGVVRRLLGQEDPATERVLTFTAETVYPALLKTPDEIDNLLKGLEGRFVPPGPSGAPTRGMANILPTGRNFYSVDPKTIPSPAAWETGEALAETLLKKYIDEEGAYPEMVGLVVWGTSAMRTHGDDIAQILSLLGVRPVWQAESRRVMGLEVIPLAELGRPRIDVTVRISGFFRDAFPNLINLLDQAVELVASLDESPEDNMVVKHLIEDTGPSPSVPLPEGEGRSSDQGEGTRSASLYRIFGSKPGTYGAGILPVIEERNWETVHDLAEVYTAWGGYAYTQQQHGVNARQEFRRRFSQIVVAAKNQDNREHDIFDSDDYMQYHGGMIATVRALTGRNPRQFFGDSADPSRSRVRDLADEARRVFRTRVVNPKWVDSMKRHGYKGAFELAATVDYMFGYDATAQVVEDWMYEGLTESYVLDPETWEFFQQSNPWALKSVVERLLEAIQRGMWENPPPDMEQKLKELYLQLETDLEARQEARPSAGASSPSAAGD